MANNFINGKVGTITVNSTQFATRQYSFREEVPWDDITFTQSGGAAYQVLLAGYGKASGTLTFVYDTMNKPFLSPLLIVVGTTATLSLLPDGVGAYAITAAIFNFGWPSGPAAGPVLCSVDWQSTGSYTRPAS